MKNTFTINVFFLFYLLFHLWDEVKSVSVMEGDSVTLHTGLTDTQRYDQIVWTFGDDGILIVKDDREDNKTTFTLDKIYGDRLELNYQTGSLTITDARITDTGLYKVKISGRRRTEHKGFSVTVSGSGVSSGGVAGIVIVVLLAMSAAVGVFVFFIRRRTSEIKKQNDVSSDKSVSMKPGDSVILHTDVKEIQKDDEITWMFEDTSIAKMRGDQTVENIDERFRDKLELNPQTGSLTIKDTKTKHTGLYKVKMRLQDVTSTQIFSVSESDKLSVNEGDPFTLSSGHTELGDNVMTWRFKDKRIATVSEHQTSVCDEERFKDRVHVDPQTGSLTVTNSRTGDSGLYQLQISGKEKSERKFTVRVREKIRKVSVVEGDSFILNTGDAFIQRPDMIQWEFKHKCIAELTGNTPAAVDKDERFTDRLELNHQTGSLTVTNSRTTDSGLYTLKIGSEDSEWKFRVTVRGRLPWEKRPELKVNEGDPFTLSSGHTELGDNVMTWRFKDKQIATVSERQTSVCDEERFKDRVQVDPQTGSLTVTNSRTGDSGLYQLQISGKEKSERKFTVSVREKFRNVSVMEGDYFTLNTGDAFIQRPDMIQWEFKHKCIAELTGNTPAAVDKDERFTDRLKLDHQTGSLTVTNSRTTDSGLYTLKIGSEDSEWKFRVTVREKIRKVSVMDGDSFILNTGDAFTQRPDMIQWEFKHKCIAELTGNTPAAVDKDDRFTDRLELDPQTGSLTVTNTRTTDSGRYTLMITPERKFNVTVSGRPLWEKRPKQKTKKIKPVSVNEGDSLTLSTGDALTQSPEMIKWMFDNICIAEFTGVQRPAEDVDKDDRFRGRLELDYKDASLTITNITSKDSGRYRLRARTGDSERTFIITVSVLSTNAEGNDSEAAHTHTESDGLLGVRVVDNKEEMSLQEYPNVYKHK